MPQSGFGQLLYPDGSLLSNLQKLAPAGGGVSIANATETAISAVVANYFGYLQRLEAICVAASSAAGTFTLRDKVTGATLLVLEQPVTTSVVGTRYTWDFPTPLKMAAAGEAFSIQASANQGTWFWILNGFMLKV